MQVFTSSQPQWPQANGSTTYASEPARASVIGETIETLAVANKILGEQVGRARSIADVTFGPAPEQQTAGAGAPGAASGRVSALESEKRILHTLLAELSLQLDRLSCL